MVRQCTSPETLDTFEDSCHPRHLVHWFAADNCFEAIGLGKAGYGARAGIPRDNLLAPKALSDDPRARDQYLLMFIYQSLHWGTLQVALAGYWWFVYGISD